MTKNGLPSIGDSVYIEYETPVNIGTPEQPFLQHGRHGRVTLVWHDNDAVWVYFPGTKWHTPKGQEFSFDDFEVGKWNQENYTWELVGDYPELAC